MKKLMLFAMWLAASGAAVATAWAGVSVVDNQVAPPSVIGLDRGDRELAIQRPGGGAAATSSSLDLSPSSDPTTSTGLSIDGSGSNSTEGTTVAGSSATSGGSRTSTTQGVATNSSGTTSSGSTSSASTSGNSSTSSSSSTNSTAGTSAPTTSTTQATTSTTQATTSTTQATTSTTQASTTTQGATTKTFNLVGGSTAVSFSSSGVQVLWATPKPGFDVDIEPEGSGMKVEFESDDHRSRIDVWWSGGPQHQIRERAD